MLELVMDISPDKLKFTDGAWRTDFLGPSANIGQLWIKGDERTFESPAEIDALKAFVASVDELIAHAIQYATSSEYCEDVEWAGGLSLTAIVVNTWADCLVWFSLNSSEPRMLAVRFLSGVPTDVFCDHP
jgi:hypothetical protein